MTTSRSNHRWKTEYQSDTATCIDCGVIVTATGIRNGTVPPCTGEPEVITKSRAGLNALIDDIRDVTYFPCGCKPCVGQCRSEEAMHEVLQEVRNIVGVGNNKILQRTIDIQAKQFSNLRRMYETAEAENRALKRELEELRNKPLSGKKWNWRPML